MNREFVREIKRINENIIEINVSLKKYNTLKLESSVKYFIKPTTFMELKKVVYTIKKFDMTYHVIGNGSNIIFTESKKECIIKINFKKSKHTNIMHSNELLMIKAQEFLKKGFKGLEYIANIPASVGGAILMNAGAYNHYFSDIVEFVYYLDDNLKFKVIKKENCCFSYRNSIFKNSRNIILGCKTRLLHENEQTLKNTMEKCNQERKKTQPIDFPNCGSIFKNKDNICAWKLIEKVSLRGYKKNQAMISDKHCNFIVNLSNASSKDIIFLINLVKQKVKERFCIELQEEVIIID